MNNPAQLAHHFSSRLVALAGLKGVRWCLNSGFELLEAVEGQDYSEAEYLSENLLVLSG